MSEMRLCSAGTQYCEVNNLETQARCVRKIYRTGYIHYTFRGCSAVMELFLNLLQTNSECAEELAS